MIHNRQLREEGVVIFGAWEPLYFEAQSGVLWDNSESRYEFIRSDAFIRHLAEVGVNQYWTHFFKGYGNAFEHEAQQRTRALAGLCHAHGMKVVAYISAGSLTPETLLATNPEAEDWICRTADGTPARWLQSFRTKPCYSSRGYIEHLKEAVDRAFEYGCDGIHFDNMAWSLDSDGCRCERCIRLFRDFLTGKYGTAASPTRQAGLWRFGRNAFSTATPPFRNTNETLTALRVANEQEWRLFKMKVLTDMVRELSDHIRANGKLVEYNVLWCPFMNLTRFGLDLHEILSRSDMVFYEGSPRGPSYNKQGAPMSRIRSFKVCAEYGVPMLCTNATPLDLAECFAFNPGSLGMVLNGGFGGDADSPWGDPAFRDRTMRFYRFYHRYKHYQTQSTSLANVAVLHHSLSMTFDSLFPYEASGAVEQILQEACIPFRIIFSERLDDVRGIALLIIPAMATLLDRERDVMARAVEQDGLALLVVQRAGVYDDYGRVRARAKTVERMQDLLHAHDVEQAFAPLAGEAFDRDFVKRVGKGSVGFVRNLDLVERPRSTDETVRPDQIHRPRNSEAILAAVRALLGGKEPLRVESKADLVVDILRREDSGEGVIHLLNVSCARNEKASAKVWFRWPEEVVTITEIRYDRDPAPLPIEARDGGYAFDVNDIGELSTVVVNRRAGS